MIRRVWIHALLMASVALATTAQADVVEVSITGEVENNQIGPPPLGNVNPGDSATLTFLLESNNFVDNMIFPTRGYVIDETSFSLTLGGETFSLQNPFPAGETPYFVLRDNDPAVDGFFTATNLNGPNGVPINQNGIFGQFRNVFSVTYTGDTLSSLDILDALGTYDFTGLTVFNFAVTDGPFKPLLIIFEQMTISSVGECFLVVGGQPGSDQFTQGFHTWTTQIGGVQSSYEVLLEDIPEFLIPGQHSDLMLATGLANRQPAMSPAALQGFFTVQVLMWNPEVFPDQPEQYTAGLAVWVGRDGTVITQPYGTGTGMQVWAEKGFNAAGQPILKFPFSIPGM